MATKAKKVDVKSAAKWNKAIKASQPKEFEERGDKIVKRYRDDRASANKGESKYNILWSNIRTLMPAVYGKKPNAEAARRHKDTDPVARTAAEILERCLQYEIDFYDDYDSAIKNALLDRLLPGRGVAWVRYEQDDTLLSDDVEAGDKAEDDHTEDITPTPSTGKQCTPVDYVFWKDYRHNEARTYEELTWQAKRVYMGRDEGVKRFGKMFNKVELTHVPKGLEKSTEAEKNQARKAKVWEIWNKPTKTVIWIAEDFEEILDEKADPLELDNFWPCPKPLFATLTTDSLVPVADFIMYQDQAKELDTLTARIKNLAEACKLVGVYDSTQKAVGRMLDEGVENTMIPVATWAAFGEKGGLAGAMDFLPLDMIIKTLHELYTARDQCKQVIYEVTGLSDIIRGASVASETATAQQIKSQYASLRLKDMQNDVARFASDLLRIKAQIMTNLYSPETLLEMSGIEQTSDGEDPEQVQAAVKLLKTDSMRSYRIEVASDSLIEIDEQGERDSRLQFLEASTAFLEKAAQMPPVLAPLMGELLMFGVKGFKSARTIEGAFDEAMKNLSEPQQPQQDPKMLEQQQQMQQQLQKQGQELQKLTQDNQKLTQTTQQDALQMQQLKADKVISEKSNNLDKAATELDNKIQELQRKATEANIPVEVTEGGDIQELNDMGQVIQAITAMVQKVGSLEQEISKPVHKKTTMTSPRGKVYQVETVEQR